MKLVRVLRPGLQRPSYACRAWCQASPPAAALLQDGLARSYASEHPSGERRSQAQKGPFPGVKSQQALKDAAFEAHRHVKQGTKVIKQVVGDFIGLGDKGSSNKSSEKKSGDGGPAGHSSAGPSSAGSSAGGASDRGESTSSSSFNKASFFARARGMFSSGTGSGSSSSDGSSGGAGEADAEGTTGPTLVERLRREVAEAVLPPMHLQSMMRRQTDVEAATVPVAEGASELAISETPMSWLDRLREKLGNTPLGRRIASLQSTDAARHVAEGIADLKERIEGSDSEVLGRFADMRERMREESEAAVAYREIRMRHPKFDMPTFLRAMKNDVPVVIKAYLDGHEAILKEYCAPGMLERLIAIYKATREQGQITDPTILEYSDVDMVDMKMLDGDPVIILHFNCQQINCVRDPYGTVISGAPTEVQRVYYYWAVQQDSLGMVTRTGEYIPPRWMLTEMMLRGMHHLL